MLCEKCQQREASVHITTIHGDVIKKTDLCDECHAIDSPEHTDLLVAARDAHCEYCGAQPCVGGVDILGTATGNPKNKFLCLPCAQEHGRYIQQHISTDCYKLSQPEQLATLRELNQKADQHMQQWISKKRSGN